MNELLNRALQGVDPDSPGAFWQIFGNLMRLVPWWPMFWFTVACVVVGCAIAWYRGSSYRKAVIWALILGPFGWLISWYQVPGSKESGIGDSRLGISQDQEHKLKQRQKQPRR